MQAGSTYTTWMHALLRTCFLISRTRAPEVLQYFSQVGLITSTQHLVDFILLYDGPTGDRGTSETATNTKPQDMCCFLWQTFRADGMKVLDAIVEARSVSKTIAILRRAFSGFDGTGFVAKTVTHLLFDCDRDAKLFGMRNDDYSTPAWVPMLAKSLT